VGSLPVIIVDFDRLQATLEDVDTKHPRGLDSKLLRTLGEGLWIREKRGVIITGPPGSARRSLVAR